MRIENILDKIYSNVIRKGFPDQSEKIKDGLFTGVDFFSDYETFSLVGARAYCRKGTNKWFTTKFKKKDEPVGLGFWFGVNLIELSLSDDEKFDTIEDLKKHYGLERLE